MRMHINPLSYAHMQLVAWSYSEKVFEHSPPHLIKITNNTDKNLPPVFVKLSVTKAQQLSCEVQRWVEEPIEKHQPKQVIRNLERHVQVSWTRTTHDPHPTCCCMLSIRSNCLQLKYKLAHACTLHACICFNDDWEVALQLWHDLWS